MAAGSAHGPYPGPQSRVRRSAPRRSQQRLLNGVAVVLLGKGRLVNAGESGENAVGSVDGDAKAFNQNVGGDRLAVSLLVRRDQKPGVW
jgi:hypothetical protein